MSPNVRFSSRSSVTKPLNFKKLFSLRTFQYLFNSIQILGTYKVKEFYKIKWFGGSGPSNWRKGYHKYLIWSKEDITPPVEVWRAISGFTGYSVSTFGRVRNEWDGRIMTPLVNQQGVVHVGLTKNRVQHKRVVSRLVGEAFIVRPQLEAFDTLINLDGDRLNNRVDNLLWRPRWFAVKYFSQFRNPNCGIRTPIQDLESGEMFDTSWDAAIKYGLLELDIFKATLNGTPVWPTYQRFGEVYSRRY